MALNSSISKASEFDFNADPEWNQLPNNADPYGTGSETLLKILNKIDDHYRCELLCSI
jgi:hypothetical protein